MIAPERGRHAARWLGVAAVGVILSMIALGHNGPSAAAHKVDLIPLAAHIRNLACLASPVCRFHRAALLDLTVDFAGNVIVFVPFGASLAFALDGRPHAVLTSTMAGVVLSVAFEIAQWWIPGRVVATSDVILNMLGALLGAQVVTLAIRWHRQRSDAFAAAHGTHGVR
jgi:glycopeptide antibiotics resistance protein